VNAYAALVLGVLAAAIGGELFVRGLVGIARWARVSSGIIAATVAAFATSSPELSVAIGSALAGVPAISLGDALGSNVANVGLILGVTVAISGVRAPRDSIRRDFPIAFLAPIGLGLLLLDGRLSRLEALLLFAAFGTWLVAAIREAARQRSAGVAELGERRHWPALALSVAGLALLIAAGRLIVVGAEGIAEDFGIPPFVIGATLVAIGTSVPELATAVVAKLRGHDEVGLGTVLGSNIFNTLFIVGTAASIHPIEVAWRELAIALVFGVVTVLVALPSRAGWIGRGRGTALLALYLAYVALALAG
jgi:cation:H+ antiporter